MNLTVVADATKFQEAMKVAAEDVITSEPDLTRWDTVSAPQIYQYISEIEHNLTNR
jgi:hypothetical protein